LIVITTTSHQRLGKFVATLRGRRGMDSGAPRKGHCEKSD
jgi:hypothetical protein